jgi:DNA mismatch repair protein MutS2
LEIRKKHALVAFGALKTQVKIDDLILVEKKEKKDGSKVRLERQSESDGSFEKELDLRGKTREEVIELLHKFLNEAIMSKVYQVRIVHGKGTGTSKRLSISLPGTG